MILPQLILLTTLHRGQSSQQGQGKYYVQVGASHDDYFPTFLTEDQKKQFESELSEAKSFSQYNHLVSKIPTDKPHGMFVATYGQLTSLYFENAKIGNLGEGADMKVVANYTNGDKLTQYLKLAPGLPAMSGNNFRVHFMHPVEAYAKTFDIVVRLKDGSWVKLLNWLPIRR